MRIQWSSRAAQEMLRCLEQASRSMEDCLRQSSAVRAALTEANPDGANRVMRRASERYAQLSKRLANFEEELETFQRAVHRADDLFDDAEMEVGQRMGTLDGAQSAPNNLDVGGDCSIRWEPGAYAVMPDMRLNAVTVPDWLRTAAAEDDAIAYME